MKTEENPSAFPWANDANKEYNWINRGMTLRDYFAAAALQGMLAHGITDDKDWISFADYAYAQADAMLQRRARQF